MLIFLPRHLLFTPLMLIEAEVLLTLLADNFHRYRHYAIMPDASFTPPCHIIITTTYRLALCDIMPDYHIDVY